VTVECVIPNRHHRIVVGSKWCNIHDLTQRFNVAIKFPDRKPSDQSASQEGLSLYTVAQKLKLLWCIAVVFKSPHCLICQVDVQLNSTMPLISGKLIDVIDHHEKIFLITYFRTTPMADVNFTSLVTSLIMCHHCVSHLLYPPFYASPMASSAL